MIRSIHIKDYLLISEIHIDFSEGLTAITGETGAGKSLIVDSLALATGARADSGVVRNGCSRSEISVVFDAACDPVAQWLSNHELHDGSDCILRRIIHRNQPSKAFVNGVPVSRQSLRSLGDSLVDIHSQHEHQLLLRQPEQRRILDSFAGHRDTAARLDEMARSIRRLEAERKQAADHVQRLTERKELLEHQFAMLDELKPESGEFAALERELAALANAEDLAVALHDIAQRLHYADDAAVSAALLESERRLSQSVESHCELGEYATMLEEARLRVDDVARELRGIADRTEHDPQRIAAVEERMSALQQQARIHQANPDALDETLVQLQSDLGSVQSEFDGIASIDRDIEAIKSEHRALSCKLSEVRTEAASALERQITESMHGLGMEGGVFQIELIRERDDEYTGYGHENILFKAATNPGHKAEPLSKVASGGELSRLSLALQVNASGLSEVASIVFDEIDVGIGGRVAESVGRLLQQLGKSVQVLCITHLAQVASCANHQLNVVKSSADESKVDIRLLQDDERISELARMLGGAKITAQATEHAKQMLSANLQ